MDFDIGGWRRFMCYLTRWGDVPSHVGIIMDGNRRYATKNGMNRLDGHEKGSQTLSMVLAWSYYLNIKTLSVFALSTENLKRSQIELDRLMKLTRQNFDKLFAEREKLVRYDVKVEVVGDLSKLDDETLQSITNVTEFTKNHSSLHLIVLLNYSSKYELINAIQCCSNKNYDSKPPSADNFYDELLVQKPLDLLIRTAGECRLSDFLLYQASHAMIKFVDCCWPEFTFLEFVAILLEYKFFLRWKHQLPSLHS